MERVGSGRPQSEDIGVGQVQVLCDDPVLQAEYEFLLKCFDDLKAQEDAELRISVTRARESRHIEIIYAGIHKKKSLEPLRSVYRARAKSGVIRG